MKFAFVTCVQIGLRCIKTIYEIGEKLDLIITLPDTKAVKKSGRIYVDDFARENNIPVVKVNHINDDAAIAAIRSYQIDWLFIIGWSQIASKEVLDSSIQGTIGAHPTLLPRGRGRAAIPWAIIKGMDKTGVTFFKMDQGVDTGLILEQEEIPITENETSTTLYEKVNTAHEALIKKLYPVLKRNQIKGIQQNEEEATYWPGRKPEDGEITQNMSLDVADRLVRATTKPYPGAFIMRGNKKITIWKGIKSISKIANPKYHEIKLKDGYYYAINYKVDEY